jgi:E1 N-terminal domain/ThiF family
MTPAQENERMLARVLGISEDEAATKLSRTVAITAGHGEAAAFATELTAQLERTITIAGPGEPCDLEVTVHAPSMRGAPKTLAVVIRADMVAIGRDITEQGAAANQLHGVQRVLAACYTAGFVLANLIHKLGSSDLTDPFVIRFDALGATLPLLSAPINLADTALAGAGAVGNGFLHAARHLDITGALTIVDPKVVGEGNLNRCFFFDGNDVGKPKAERLAAKAQADFPRLRLEPVVATFSAFREAHGRVRRVIVGTDSRQARRTIQSELPLEVLDASTTGITEVIVHSHRRPTAEACLA